jgi:hypothetical protein
MFKDLRHIAAVTYLCMSAATVQSSPSEDKELGEMHCFAVLVIAAAGAKKPDQTFFENPEYLETIAQCNASPESCRQTAVEIQEEGWPMPPGLSCRG